MSASLQFFSLTPQTLPAHHSSSAAAVSASSLLAPHSLKPLPKLVLSFNSIGSYAAHPASRFVRNVAFSSEVDEEVDEDEEDEDEDEDSDFSGADEQSYSADVKLFVGNLPFTVDSSALAGLFERAGNVEMVEDKISQDGIIVMNLLSVYICSSSVFGVCVLYMDKQSGRSRGFAFVTMGSVKEAEAAVQQFNGYELQGRPLRVNSGPPPPKTENSFRDNNSSFRDNNSSYRDNNSSYRDNNSSYRDNNSSYRGDRSSSRGDGNSFRGGDRSSSRGGDRPSFRGGDDSSSYRGDRSSSFRGGDDSSSFRGNRDRSSSDSSNRLYVGNLAWGVDNLTLETLFGEQGRVQEASVVYDRESGRSRGFGFVTYGSSKDVDNAISALDGLDVKGRTIRVSRAEARPKREF
ncbi:hypothetical protein MIMGU_mgv1a022002mg [Erythranthe guttata]|uniref:RRM domain-containing protein n=1 Tax=Erythranthe guttata TaxID=4155 RepID=A0A022REW7_ERYGU|nr:hypothetical protein MIMGU_mgv1a022002mg [Erythranthe guttata]